MPFVSFQNKNINYTISGRGDSAVVLLHGFLEDLTMWDDLVKHLSDDYKVIAIDLLGHGKSENLSPTHSMGLMAESVKAVLENETISNFSIIGHSMGGYVALAFAKLVPSRISKLILLNSSPDSDTDQKKEDRLRAIKVLELGKKQFINEAIPNLFAEQNRGRLKKEIENAKTIAFNTSPEGISAALLGMRERESSIKWIKSNSIETIFIAGKEDGIIPFERSLDQAKRTNSELHYIENCGHMAHLEAKSECFTMISYALKPS